MMSYRRDAQDAHTNDSSTTEESQRTGRENGSLCGGSATPALTIDIELYHGTSDFDAVGVHLISGFIVRDLLHGILVADRVNGHTFIGMNGKDLAC